MSQVNGARWIGVLVATFFFVSAASFAETNSEPDPFAGVSAKTAEESSLSDSNESTGFFFDNFGFRKELMSEFGTTGPGHSASRQSVGFETLKKFSTETKTFAGVDFQGRLVRRDGFVGSLNDMEGMHRPRWALEYHNVYADFYNFLDPILSESQQNIMVGRLNARVGRFYVPFGLNLQTDTHGPVLQLSNERNFGFERDWYAGLWGILNEDLRYDLYYLVGSGYDLKYRGQSGLGAARVGLSNRYLSEYGLEGGLSAIGGQRLDPRVKKTGPVSTSRVGLDARYRRDIPTGLMIWTTEASAGCDALDPVATQLHQLEYLHSSRRAGVATQYRWFGQDRRLSSSDSSVLAEVTWYFRNDVANSNLHWIKLNAEWPVGAQTVGGQKNVIWTLQYYRYW